jgi:hypothetical protein
VIVCVATTLIAGSQESAPNVGPAGQARARWAARRCRGTSHILRAVRLGRRPSIAPLRAPPIKTLIATRACG